jgi:predicted CDP-diglyceride synthetase/phosphatidate cytidylyltransferase
MSPSTALTNSIFGFYLALAAGLLIAAGAVLALLRWGLRKDMERAWKAYLGWLIMVPIGLGVIFLGRAATIVFFTGVAIFGFKEFARATGLTGTGP